jgi:hypothetical protein
MSPFKLNIVRIVSPNGTRRSNPLGSERRVASKWGNEPGSVFRQVAHRASKLTDDRIFTSALTGTWGVQGHHC